MQSCAYIYYSRLWHAKPESQMVSLAYLSIWCVWLNETNQMNETDQINQSRPSRSAILLATRSWYALLIPTEVQALWGWRNVFGGRRVRPGWCIGCEAAFARLIIDRIIGCNEVVLSHCWCSDIHTRHCSQRSKKRSLARRSSAGLLAALIDAISCQIRFTIGCPRQRGTPRSTRRQYENSDDGSYPVHIDTPMLGSHRK